MPSETPPALAEQGMNSQNQEVKTDGSKNEWKRFVELAEMYKKEGKCITNTQVNVTVALKNTFEHLRLSGIYVPIKSIVSAALHAFLENNAGEIQKMDNPKLQSSVELLMKNMCESNELNNKTP